MSYCSPGDDSDVYVIATAGGWECVGCNKTAGPFPTRRDIYHHLLDHLKKDRVPEHAFKRLMLEMSEEYKAGEPKWTAQEAKDMLAKLSLYYGEPVKPISQYCNAFRTWQKAIGDAYQRETDPYTKQSFATMVHDIRNTSLHVTKSNLLARLLYNGEELRTEPCPIHKGHWSGCVWGDDACPHCMSGSNVTGWMRSKG